jgi:hypothetical protein
MLLLGAQLGMSPKHLSVFWKSVLYVTFTKSWLFLCCCQARQLEYDTLGKAGAGKSSSNFKLPRSMGTGAAAVAADPLAGEEEVQGLLCGFQWDYCTRQRRCPMSC